MIGWCDSGKARTRMVLEAFIAGSGGELREERDPFAADAAAFFGVTRNLLPVFNRVHRSGSNWFYIDNNYLGGPDWFRVTRNAKQWNLFGPARPDRLAQLGVKIKPWRREGAHVLICLQSDWWYELHGDTAQSWLERFWGKLDRVTDRPVLIRRKGEPRSLAEDLRNCWAVVTHSSNVAVQAILAGVPAFCTYGDAAARVMGNTDLDMIERPVLHDGRAEWAAVLAAHQWTLDEMRSGQCWRALKEFHP